jgi:hypothetical protein
MWITSGEPAFAALAPASICLTTSDMNVWSFMLMSNQGAAANRRLAGQSDGVDNLSAIVAADRAFPAAVAELGRWT